jgi:hypothetical protein
MKTLPSVSFEGHIRNLLDWLRQRVPNIDAMPLRFFDRHDLELKQGRWILPTYALKDVDAMRAFFEELCNEGREWVNLAGDDITPHGEYLISVEYSDATGRPVTAINLAGPPLNSDGNVKHPSHILV